MYNDVSDEDLLQRYYQTGDNQWLGPLLDRYGLLLFGFCAKQLNDKTLARDTVQQVQLIVIQHIDRTRVENFHAWLFTIARNECNIVLRNRRVVRREVKENDVPEAAPEFREAFEEGRDRLFDEAMAALPEAQRACIRLFYLSGERKKYDEVAAATGYSIKEVKTHIQNGKRNLKKTIDKMRNQY
jgi:RNA polymerase sigma-70 factor (ECF subfamily)